MPSITAIKFVEPKTYSGIDECIYLHLDKQSIDFLNHFQPTFQFSGAIEVEYWLKIDLTPNFFADFIQPISFQFKFLYPLKQEKTLRLELQLQRCFHGKIEMVFNSHISLLPKF